MIRIGWSMWLKKAGGQIAIAGYLGSGDVFDRSVTDFAFAYADQNDREYKAFVDAIKSGKIQATTGE